MANDQDNGGDGEARRGKQSLPKNTVEQAKSAILHGVGYRRPPEAGRFRKGQSGNPKGRPKTRNLGPGSSRSANALALREGERLINVREGEEIRQILAIEAVYRSQLKSATSGSAYAQKHFIARYDWAERERREQRMEEIEYWKAYVADQREAIAAAKAKDETPPTPLPHPDDVLIDYEKGVQFIGPISDREVALIEENLRTRDTLIIQNALEQREVGNPSSDDALDRPGTAMVFALVLNRCVPERLRLSDNEILLRVMRYDVMPKRVLLKELYRAWRALGAHPRRGRTFPPLRFAKQVIDQIDDDISSMSARRHSGVASHRPAPFREFR